MQWSVNEQCFQLHECESYATFIAAGKPVFNIEYPKGDTRNDSEPVDASQLSGLCDQVQNKDMGFSTILKNMNLDAWIGFCNGTFAVLT